MLDLFFRPTTKRRRGIPVVGSTSELNGVEARRLKQREYEYRYWLKNREKVNARSVVWQKANPEKHRAANKKWAAANRELMLARKQLYRLKNREKLNLKAKEYRDRLRTNMQPSPCGNEQKGVGRSPVTNGVNPSSFYTAKPVCTGSVERKIDETLNSIEKFVSGNVDEIRSSSPCRMSLATKYGKNQEEKRAAAVRTMVAMGDQKIIPEGLRDSYQLTDHLEEGKSAW